MVLDHADVDGRGLRQQVCSSQRQDSIDAAAKSGAKNHLKVRYKT
jgi:hypothetical protein